MSFKKIIFFLIISLIIAYLSINVGRQKMKEIKIDEFLNNQISVNNTEENNYIAVLEIPKLKLKQGFYNHDNPLNTTEKNIELNKKSDMPNIKNGNLILAAHSGYSAVSYFNDLEKLIKDDLVFVYYNGKKYVYCIDNFYEISKTGYAKIKRDYTKNTITLITCMKNKNKQIVYIGYLRDSF